MKEYLVPRAVRTRMEIFPGFGIPELLAVAAGAALGALLQLIPALLPLPMAAKLFGRFFCFALPPGAAWLLVKQDIGGNSLWSQLKAAREWQARPKVYYYRRSRGGMQA